MTYIQGGGSTWTTIDLSAGVETDPNNVKGGGTSLGTTSTLIAAAVHGAIDAGLDGYSNLQSIGAVPAGQRVLLIRMYCATPPTEDPGANSAYCHVLCGSVNNLVANKAYAGGFARNFAPVNQMAGLTLTGNALGGNGAYTGAMTGYVSVSFDTATQTTWADFKGYTPTSTSTQSNGSGGNITPYTNVFIGVALSQVHATPASLVTWTGVVVQYQWLDA